MRHPFCRYGYAIIPGKPFARYGIEQQAEIVKHAFYLRHGRAVDGKPGEHRLSEPAPDRSRRPLQVNKRE